MRWRVCCLQVQAQRPDQLCLSVAKKAVQLFHCSRILGKNRKNFTFSLALASRQPVGKESGPGVLPRLPPTSAQHCQGRGIPEYMSSAALLSQNQGSSVCKQLNSHTE